MSCDNQTDQYIKHMSINQQIMKESKVFNNKHNKYNDVRCISQGQKH